MPTLDGNTWGNSDPSLGSKEGSFEIPDHVPGAAQFRARQEFAAASNGSAPFARKLVGTHQPQTRHSPSSTPREFTPLLRSVKKSFTATQQQQSSYSPTNSRFRTNRNGGRPEPLLPYDELSYSSNEFDNMSGIQRGSFSPQRPQQRGPTATKGLNELLTESMPLREQETRMKELSNENTKLKIDLLQARQELHRNTPAQMKEIREEVVQLRSENMSLTTEVQQLRVTLEEREHYINQLEEQLQQRDETNRSINNHGVEAELERLQGLVADSEYEANRKQEELDTALDEIDSLKAQFESLEREREQDRYNRSVDRSMGDKSMNDQTMDSTRSSRASRLNCTLAHNDARFEITNLKHDIDQLVAEVNQKDAQIDQAQVIIQKLTSELAAKREVEANADRSHSTTEESLRRQIDEYAAHIERIKEEKERDIKTMHADLDAHVRRAEHDHSVELEKAHTEIQRLTAELELKETQITELQTQIGRFKTELESVPMEMEPLRAAIARLEQDKLMLEGTIADLEIQLKRNAMREDDRQQLAAQRDDLMHRLTQTESERNHYRENLESRSQYWVHEKALLESQRDSLQEKLDNVDQKHTNGHTPSRGYAAIVAQEQEKLRVYQLQAEHTRNEMQKLIDTQYQDLRRQTDELNAASNEIARLVAVDKKLQEMSNNIGLMEQHFQAEQNRRAHAEEKGQILENQVREAEERLREMSNRPPPPTQGNESFMALNNNLQEQNRELRSQIDAGNRELNGCKIELETATRLQQGAEKNVEFLEKRVAELDRSIGDLRVHLAKVEQERDDLVVKKEDESPQSSLDYALCLLSEKEGEITEIRATFAGQKKKLVDYIKKLRDGRRQTRSEIVPLQKLNQVLENELQEKEALLAEKEAALAEKSAALADKKAAHEQSRSVEALEAKHQNDVERLAAEIYRLRGERDVLKKDLKMAQCERDSYRQKYRDSQETHQQEMEEQIRAIEQMSLKEPFRPNAEADASTGSPRHGFQPGPKGRSRGQDHPDYLDAERNGSRGRSHRYESSSEPQPPCLAGVTSCHKCEEEIEFLKGEIVTYDRGVRFEMCQTAYLRIKLQRSQELRASLVVQKVYYDALVAELRFCNRADLKLLQSMGLTPTVKKKKRAITFGAVAQMVLATVMLKRLGEEYAEDERKKLRLKDLADTYS
ncbi:Myosin-13 [Yarrowia sp. C11]|nr:Myosin-13 [Yarrowia sp. C11]KAG5359435.1 Myosin-13 [Yarrowia sp. E02]